MLSVIIPSRDRPVLLRKTLDSLIIQNIKGISIEILIIDDGSKIPLDKSILPQNSPHTFKILHRQGGGIASARNSGAKEAKGKRILFLDDDIEAGKQLLTSHWEKGKKFGSKSVILGSLPFHPDLHRTALLLFLESFGQFDLFSHPEKYPEGRPPAMPLNGNSSLDRNFFLSLGGFNEEYKAYGGEDLELGFRLEQAGADFHYACDAVGKHFHKKDLKAFLSSQRSMGSAVYRLSREFPVLEGPKRVSLITYPRKKFSKKEKRMFRILYLLLLFPYPLYPLKKILSSPLLPAWKIFYPFFRLLTAFEYACGMIEAGKENEHDPDSLISLVRQGRLRIPNADEKSWRAAFRL